MNNLQNQITKYLIYCQEQKRLDSKTLKAYQIDLKQFCSNILATELNQITPDIIEKYISKELLVFNCFWILTVFSYIIAYRHTRG